MSEQIISLLRSFGIKLERGLSEAEFQSIEKRFYFRFPPDLRALLRHALPVSPGFPNWRSDSESSLAGRLWEPILDISLSVQDSGYWLAEWGERPDDLQEAVETAIDILQGYPRLIPVFNHRCMPSEPFEMGNPVLSIVGLDIIVYGENLHDYVLNEFGNRNSEICINAKCMRGWSRFVLEMDSFQK